MNLSNVSNFLKKNQVVILLLLVLYFCMTKNQVKESFFNFMNDESKEENTQPTPVVNVRPNNNKAKNYGNVNENSNMQIPSCAQFVSSNLLPKDDPKLDASFSEFSPAKDLQGQNFIDTNKYAIGMQSQSLRNANHQLRSDPPISNTMECSSPWNNSTITPENRRQLSIGTSA